MIRWWRWWWQQHTDGMRIFQYCPNVFLCNNVADAAAAGCYSLLLAATTATARQLCHIHSPIVTIYRVVGMRLRIGSIDLNNECCACTAYGLGRTRTTHSPQRDDDDDDDDNQKQSQWLFHGNFSFIHFDLDFFKWLSCAEKQKKEGKNQLEAKEKRQWMAMDIIEHYMTRRLFVFFF